MNFENKWPKVNEAIGYVSEMRAKFQAEGNVDSENDVLNNLLIQLESGAINPDEAISQARSLDNSRIER